MRHLSVRMTVRSPLAIRSDHAPGGAAGMKYIPGTTFLGSLATLYSLLYREREEMNMFAPLFLHEQVLYSNLYPAIFNDSEGLQDERTSLYPLPKTAQSCKRHAGFRFPNNGKNDGHGVRDTLIDWALYKLASSNPHLQAAMIPSEIFLRDRECHCGEEMEHFDSYYRRGTLSPYHMIAADVAGYTRVQTHTGIHRESGTVQESILYSRQVFEEGMEFSGRVSLPDDGQLLTKLERFITAVGNKGMLRLGTGRTRGMGKVTLDVKRTEEEQASFDIFVQRLNEFNGVFHNRATDFGLNILPYGYFFALTLHSPLLLCDDLLRYRGTIDAIILEGLLGLTVPGLSCIYYAADMRRVTGWLELWGTPRTSEYAIETGSVFLFACSSPPDLALLKALFALEENGVGRRRSEGFGSVVISDQFHKQIHQEVALA